MNVLASHSWRMIGPADGKMSIRCDDCKVEIIVHENGAVEKTFAAKLCKGLESRVITKVRQSLTAYCRWNDSMKEVALAAIDIAEKVSADLHASGSCLCGTDITKHSEACLINKFRTAIAYVV